MNNPAIILFPIAFILQCTAHTKPEEHRQYQAPTFRPQIADHIYNDLHEIDDINYQSTDAATLITINRIKVRALSQCDALSSCDFYGKLTSSYKNGTYILEKVQDRDLHTWAVNDLQVNLGETASVVLTLRLYEVDMSGKKQWSNISYYPETFQNARCAGKNCTLEITDDVISVELAFNAG